MASFVYQVGADGLLDGSISWMADSIKVRLVDSAVAFSKADTSMVGYAAISVDQLLVDKTCMNDIANKRIVFDAADRVWPLVAAGSTIGWIVVYKSGAGDAGSTPLACLDIADIQTDGSDVTVEFDVDGIFHLQQES